MTNSARRFLITATFLFSFRSIEANGEKNDDSVDPLKIKFHGSLIEVSYQYVVVDLKPSNGRPARRVRIPIYGGTTGAINAQVLTKYMKGTLKEKYVNPALTSLLVRTQPGQTKRELMKIVRFYSKELFGSEATKPSKIGCDGPVCWFIWYDFKLNGVDCSLLIFVGGDEGAPKRAPTTIDEIRPHDNEDSISLQFFIDNRSPFYKGKK